MTSLLWSVVSITALVVWLLSAVLFMFAAFPERGRFEARPALTWGGVVLVSFFFWIAGMLNA